MHLKTRADFLRERNAMMNAETDLHVNSCPIDMDWK